MKFNLPSWYRAPGTFVGISFCGADVSFSGGAGQPVVVPWSFDDFFDVSFG